MQETTGKLAIGVDIGGTRSKYGLVDTSTGKVLQSMVKPTEKGDAERFLQQVSEIIEAFKTIAAQTGGDIAGIGFGVPGFVNEEGIVETTYGFLAFMEKYPLQTVIERQFSLKCFIDNDARTVCLGEALYGKGKGYKRVLNLTLGTGVGLGFVVNGRFAESLPLAHMGGHMKITADGETCYCGKKGCLEALVSSTGIRRLAKSHNLEGAASIEAIFEAAFAGNANAAFVVDNMVDYLHTAIHNYVNIFAPDMIVLGGGIAKGLVSYLDKIKGKGYLSPYPGYSFELSISELEEQAGMIGSAALLQLDILKTIKI